MIVLDTHTLLWLALEPERLSETAATTIDQDPERTINVISAQEIAYLVARGRVDLDRPPKAWLGEALNAFEVQPIPTTVQLALRAGSLDPEIFHGEPIDRLIYATAVEHDARLVSADRRMREADPARVVW
jgi:PIN domain nuclease of toxin-antitoxin system